MHSEETKIKNKRPNHCTLYKAGFFFTFPKHKSPGTIYNLPKLRLRVETYAHKASLKKGMSQFVSSLPQALLYPLLSLLCFPQELFLKRRSAGNSGVLLGLFVSTFLGLLPDFSVVFSDLKTGTRKLSQSKAKNFLVPSPKSPNTAPGAAPGRASPSSGS